MDGGRKTGNNSPLARSSLSEIEDLSRVQQPLELLHQLGALVAAALGVQEHDDGLHVGRRDRLDGERSRLILLDLRGW